MVTLKSTEEMFNAIRLHLYRIILETDTLISSMDSIYSRARTQAPLIEVSQDCKRFRNFKTKNPKATLPDVLNAFHANKSKPRFVHRFLIQGEVVHEAGRRIGADNYGASLEFSKLFDLVTDEELTSLETNNTNANVEANNNVNSDVNPNFNSSANCNNVTKTPKPKRQKRTPPLNSPANLDFDKLQDAIKKALESKLNKN